MKGLEKAGSQLLLPHLETTVQNSICDAERWCSWRIPEKEMLPELTAMG